MSNGYNQGFSMPMFRDFVPRRLRPWIYVYFAFCFQLTCGVYLGSMEQMRGSLDFKREDIMMCLYATLCGLALYFPMLFRTKFRFTNRSLLLFSSIGIAALSILALHVKLLPILWIICFIVGALKLQGTFECLSNIQLWITPKRDFGVFFPVLHFFIMISLGVSDILAIYFSYYVTWHYMSYLIIGIMLFNALWIAMLILPVRMMPKTPLLAIDWLGFILWALAVMQIAFVFCYGEYYNWFTSKVICTVSITAIITIILALLRMTTIHHPYIEPKIFLARNLAKFLLVALVIEAVMATEHVLEGMFYAAGPGWDAVQRSTLNYPMMAGAVGAIFLALFWLKIMKWKPIRLIACALAVFAAYSMWFYFHLSPQIELHHLFLPVFLRGFATTLMAISMIYIVKSFVHFMVFFQALATFQCLHLVIGGVIGAAIYTFGARYFVGDHLAHYAGAFDATSLSMAATAHDVPRIMSELQLSSLKQLYGLVTYAALSILLLVLLWDIPVTRGLRQRIPSVATISQSVIKRLRRSHSSTAEC